MISYLSRRTCRSSQDQSSQNRLTRLPARLQERSKDADGYSLIELLVVILIIGILAAIAIPSFLNQKGKALDTQAKELARTAETTAETISTDNSGTYEHVTTTELHAYEPTIRITPSPKEAYVSAATSSKTEYSITAKSTNGDELTVSKGAAGTITRSCVSPITKVGCSGGEHGSW